MDSTCSSCGKSVSGNDVLYSPDAAILCAACYAHDDLERTDKRAAENIRKSAYTALGFALISWVVNPFFLLTILSVSAGGYAIRSFRPDNHRFYKHIEKSRFVILACAYVGTGVALLPISLRLFGALLAGSR